jgi:sugar-specific transcriptional regulator TrmB
MDAKVLINAGLSEAESLIYITLLRIGTATVKEIAQECGYHRTNIYDVLEQLREKGLVSSYREGKTTRYSAADPENLLAYLKEKEDWLSGVVPDLKKLQGSAAEAVEVEVLKGEEGMKAIFRDILRENKPWYAFGVRGQFREHLPVYAKQWFRDATRQKLKYYGIYTTRKDRPFYYTGVRFVKEEYNSPVATFIYGDKICINIWEPALIAIVIKSKEVAQVYKKHFDLLWALGKKE